MKIIGIFLFVSMILLGGCVATKEATSRNTYLQALGETNWPLEDNSLNEAYRLTCLSSYNGTVVITILVCSDGTGAMTTKVADGGYGRVEEIIHSSKSHLSTNQVNQLRIAKSKVVAKPAQAFIPDSFHATGGSRWYLETILHGYYETLNRQNPSYDNRVIEDVFLNKDAVSIDEHKGLFDDDRPLLYDNRTQDEIRSYIATNKSLVDFIKLLLSWSPLSTEQLNSINSNQHMDFTGKTPAD